MTPEEFRAAAHELVDWIADYRIGIDRHPVKAQVAPGDVRRALPTQPPDEPEPIASLLADLDRVVVPGMTHVQHPMHYGWFPSNASLASVLGDFASSGLGGLGISWESNPALTEVEEVVCEWMRRLTGLGEGWKGTIHDTASVASLVAMLVARERASDLSQNRGGMQGIDAPLMVYATAQSHSSVAKAALFAGFGWDNIRLVDVDGAYAMDPEALAETMASDAADGFVPTVVVATTGTTGTTAIDPIDAIVDVAATHRAWVHVDAALAGTAMLLPECRHLWDGVDGADSLVWNPHKWLGTILDTSLFYVRDPELLQQVMSTNPSYLRSTSGEVATQYRDWGIPMGRRFRALKLWFHLRLDGVDAIRQRLRRDLDNAQWLAAQVAATPGWEVLAPVVLQTVCVRHQPPGLEGEALDRHTLAWVRAINESGEAFLTPSRLDDRWMARVSIGVESTGRSDVARLWDVMQRAAADAG